jgi:hypothetical protein
MNSVLVAVFAVIVSSFRTRAALQAEILGLRHQLAVLQANAPRRLRLKRSDRMLWVLLSRSWTGANGSTRHGRVLAPRSFRLVLDQEIAAPAGKTKRSCGDSRLDSAHEPS